MTVLSPAQINVYAMKTGLNVTQANIATAIALAESGGQTDAINPGTAAIKEYSVGLWQINILAHPQYNATLLRDPVQNANAMFAISNGGTSWTAWSTYTNGKYRQYLSNSSTSPIQTSFTPPLPIGPSQGNPEVTSSAGSGYQYLLAYTVAIAIMILIAQTKIGYRLIYYSLVLSLMLLFVTQSQFFIKAIEPLTIPSTSLSNER